MTTSMMTGVKNEAGLVPLRPRIVWARWLPVLFLLATALTVQAETYGDYTCTINPNGTIRIDGYTGSDGAVDIPSTLDGKTVIGIGSSAFAGNTRLASVTIPASVTYLEDRVFNACTSLTSVALGSGVASIGYGAFDSCANLTAITVAAGNLSYGSLDGVLFNQGQTTLVDYPEGKVGSYTLPASVTSIGDYAFLYCTGLTGVAISNGVTSIGKEAFWGCANLTGITLPASVISICVDAFNGCISLAGVTFGSGVISIGDSAFYECTSLTSVTLPASVTSIGEMAFSRCTSLAAITVDAGNSSYSSLDGVLFNQSRTILIQYPGGKAGSYTIPAGVTNIGGDAYAPWPAMGLGGFSWCIGLTAVTIPTSVTSIGKNAFLYCTSLTNITIPASVVSIGYYAFENCTGLTDVLLPVSITSIAYWAFAGCSSLTNITIPGSVTNIEAQAFTVCTSLTSVTIPNSVISIAMSAFSGCTSLASVTIGTGLTSLGDYVFSGCTNLTGVYFWGDAPGVGVDVFYNAGNATVYHLVSATGWGATFGGRPTALWDPLPELIIKANGVAGEIILDYPATVSITVELNAGNYADTEVDWWVVANARSGAWYYLDSDLQWPTFDGDVAFCQPVAQGPLANLSPYPVLDRYQLSRGTYDFWFAIDSPKDGILDPNGQIVLDRVTVVVQ